MTHGSGKTKVGTSVPGRNGAMGAKTLLTRFSTATLVLLLGAQPCLGSAKTVPSAAPAQQAAARDLSPLQNYQTQMLQSLVGDLQIPPSTVARFEAVYWRHRQELYRIAANNPGLLGATLELVLDALPALRSVGDHQGKLYLNQALFARANELWRQYEKLASPGLASDLKNLKRYVDHRTQRVDSRQVMIDLNG